MFRRIVVPSDLTDRNRPAAEMAAKLVTSDGKVHLVHVIETIVGFSVEEEREFYDRLEHAAAQHLMGLGAPLRERGTAVEAKVVYGARAKTVIEEADGIGADLIVIQSHRVEGGRREEGFGTLSYQIAIFARCPVLLVK
ncbi:MAG: universal stress protein [Vicinamibacteria bacterium]